MQGDQIEYSGERVAAYDERHFSIPTRLSIRRLENQMKGLSNGGFDPRNYGRMLDIGCGTGNVLFKLMLMGIPEGYGLDISPDMIKQAKEKTPVGIKPKFVLGTAEYMPFCNGSFDLLVCSSALHHFPDYVRVLAETYRLLEEDGEAFFLHEKNKLGRDNMRRLFNIERFEHEQSDLHEFTGPQISSICHDIGFSEVNVQTSDAISFIYHKLLRPRVPTNGLKDVGYTFTESLDRMLSRTPLSQYFVHLCIYLRK